jgi:hypothetical protein
MPRKKNTPTPKTTWKKIPQRAGKQTITRESRILRMRRLVKFATVSLGTGSLVLALALLGYYVAKTPKAQALHDAAASFVELDIQTDGVLPPAWIEYRMALAENLGLLQIDMTTVKETLESYPQIKEASIEREFPSKLCVRVRERVPAFRMKLKQESGESEIYLVDEEGYVFRNIRFPDQVTARLPFIAGVDLHQSTTGYHPIASVPLLAELYRTVSENYPDIARSWSVLFADQLIMAQSFTEGYIRVQSTVVPEILFRPENFAKQLERLDYILDSQGGVSVSSVSRVNLSLLDQPTVEFAKYSYPKTSY